MSAVRVFSDQDLQRFASSPNILETLIHFHKTNERGLSAGDIHWVYEAFHGTTPKETFITSIINILKNTLVPCKISKIQLYPVEFKAPLFKFGFANPNIRCFMHVCLVLLAKLPCLRQLFEKSNNEVAPGINNCLQTFMAQAQVVDAANVFNKLSTTLVASSTRTIIQHGQQDATLLLEDLLNIVDAEAELTIKFSTALFERSGARQVNNGRMELTNWIDVYFKPSIHSVQRGIDDFFAPTLVTFENKDCEMRKQVLNQPKVLLVRINRFSEGNADKQTRRLTLETSVQFDGAMYLLYAIIWHDGKTRNEGHYGIVINEQCALQWNNYNDAKVTRERVGVLNQLSGGVRSACAVIYLKQSEVRVQFPLKTSVVGQNTMLTRKRKVSVVCDLEQLEEDDCSPPTKKAKKISKATAQQIAHSASTDEDWTVPETTIKVRAPTAEQLNAARFEPTIKITLDQIKCIYRMRYYEDIWEWLIDWRGEKLNANWISELDIRANALVILNKYFQAPHALSNQGWKIRTDEGTPFVQSSFSTLDCGPTDKQPVTNAVDIFDRFLPAKVRSELVEEINRYASLSFADVVKERQAWRDNKVMQLKQWAIKMEQKYRGLTTVTSWVSNVKNLEEYFSTSYVPSDDDKITFENKRRNWKPLTLEEFDVFLAIEIATRCVQGRRLRDYWTIKDPLYGNEWIASKMGRDRFENIMHYLHFDIDHVVSEVLKRCHDNWSPSQKITFDETVLPFLGRFYARQFIPSKPHPNGILLHLAADDSYYVWDFDVFLGLCLPPKYQLLELAEKLNCHKPGHIIITDSKWGSEETASQLDEIGIKFLLLSKKNSPSYIFGQLQSRLKEPRQHISFEKAGVSGPIIAHSFRDSNAIMNLFSNYVDASTAATDLCSGVPSATNSKPVIIQEYTKTKGFVDEAARQIHTFDWPFKSTKWTHVVWENIINIVAWNSYQCYRYYRKIQNDDEDQFRDFLHDLKNGLSKENSSRNKRNNSPLVRKRSAKGVALKVKDNNLKSHTPHIQVHSFFVFKKSVLGLCTFCNDQSRKQMDLVCWKCSRDRKEPIFWCSACRHKHKAVRRKLKLV